MNIDNMSIDDKLTLMLAHGQAGLQKAAELRQHQMQETANIRALIPATIDALIDSEFISKEARADATRQFEDPTMCLKFLKKMAEVAIPRSSANNYEFGSPVKQEKSEAPRTNWRFGNSAEIREKADAAWWGN